MENPRGTRAEAQSPVHGAYQNGLGKEVYSRNSSWGRRLTVSVPVAQAEGCDVVRPLLGTR